MHTFLIMNKKGKGKDKDGDIPYEQEIIDMVNKNHKDKGSRK